MTTMTAETPVSAELVPSAHGTLSAEQEATAEAMIQSAAEDGDSVRLLQMAKQADWAARLADAEGLRSEATRIQRLQFMAEAAIGWMDIEAHPSRYSGKGLTIGGNEIAAGTRRRWRNFGVAAYRGFLDPAIAVLARREELSPTALERHLTQMGALWADTKPLLRALQRSGLSVRELQCRSGFESGSWYELSRLRSKSIGFATARRMAQALGVDDKSLPCATAMRGGAVGRQKARRRRQLASRALEREERSRAARKAGGSAGRAWPLVLRLAKELDAAWRDAADDDPRKDLLGRAHLQLAEVEADLGAALTWEGK